MIAIVDYGVGNLFSIASSLKKISVDAIPDGDISFCYFICRGAI